MPTTTRPLKLLLTGLIPTSDDVPQYFRELYGTADQIETKIQTDTAHIRAEGFDVTLYYVDDSDAETGLRWLENKLRAEQFDGIAIGSGLRLLPNKTELFEMVVDVCRRFAPDSIFIFNKGPGTNFESITRNLKRLKASRAN